MPLDSIFQLNFKPIVSYIYNVFWKMTVPNKTNCFIIRWQAVKIFLTRVKLFTLSVQIFCMISFPKYCFIFSQLIPNYCDVVWDNFNNRLYYCDKVIKSICTNNYAGDRQYLPKLKQLNWVELEEWRKLLKAKLAQELQNEKMKGVNNI